MTNFKYLKSNKNSRLSEMRNENKLFADNAGTDFIFKSLTEE
jgi:hypothetical protein